MASNTTQTIETLATDSAHSDIPRRRRLSWRTQLPPPSDMTAISATSPHAALLHGHDHEGPAERTRHFIEDDDDAAPDDKEDAFVNEGASKKLERMITPYLAQHIPQQYNPLGGDQDNARPPNANTKYCYRHRPDMLCRRQADELSMEQLQKELGHETQADQQSINNVWSLFSAAPAKHRNLMLQGILAQCCFPQLSYISSSVRNLIKIDFLAALPTELGFKILCYLDTTSLCKAAQVSRRWRQLADDDVVWHKMCEQHIDRKCTKCGWGLPLLDQRRLRTEKRRIQLRASGRGLNEWSPDITPAAESSSPAAALSIRESRSSKIVGTKRSVPDEPSESGPSKRVCINEPRDQQESYFDQPKKRPWKDVYKDRFKVGINWKYGRYSTTTLKGHGNGVMCLQFDDRTLMTGSYDASVKVWDLESGECIRTLTGHTSGIRCLYFDDGRLITGSLDREIRVWNWRTGECVKILRAHQSGVIGLHMADKLLASGSADHTVVVHDFNTFQRFSLRGHTDWVNSVKIDLPSRTLFSASDDCTVKLWDLNDHRCIKTFEGHVGQVQQVLPLPAEFDIDEDDFVPHANNDTSDTASLASETRNVDFSVSQETSSEPLFPDEPDRPAPPKFMLTGSLDGTIRLWHVPSGRCIHRFFGHVEGVWSLAADTLRLVSGAEDKTIKIWDPRTGKHERTLTGHTGPVTCVGLSDSRLISGSEDGTIRVHCFVGEEKELSSPKEALSPS
ncbi:sulfur metabolite repression control protein-like protein SconB [Lophiostoma macrostomum CBS 122681]|uniref:Sulfur metabolite repression control protein-like protein SconB n=1 Tax=Lophiostoma macrostomum CBS 122681 TaxID=1314788 RepID=A0A6A6T9U5_9PLEO|nr:sulfur metabolite repression control protein-like protein SconB [Lophiostoma macrostomum CBS 122681]